MVYNSNINNCRCLTTPLGVVEGSLLSGSLLRAQARKLKVPDR